MKNLRNSFPNAKLISVEFDHDTLSSSSDRQASRFDGRLRLRLSVPYKTSTGSVVDASIVKPINVQGFVDASGSPTIDHVELV